MPGAGHELPADVVLQHEGHGHVGFSQKLSAARGEKTEQ